MQVEPKQNIVENKWIERENLWIKLHVGLIKIKSHFSGEYFDDKFVTFRLSSCIMVPDPFFAWRCVAKFHDGIILAMFIRCQIRIIWHAGN